MHSLLPGAVKSFLFFTKRNFSRVDARRQVKCPQKTKSLHLLSRSPYLVVSATIRDRVSRDLRGAKTEIAELPEPAPPFISSSSESGSPGDVGQSSSARARVMEAINPGNLWGRPSSTHGTALRPFRGCRRSSRAIARCAAARRMIFTFYRIFVAGNYAPVANGVASRASRRYHARRVSRNRDRDREREGGRKKETRDIANLDRPRRRFGDAVDAVVCVPSGGPKCVRDT